VLLLAAGLKTVALIGTPVPSVGVWADATLQATVVGGGEMGLLYRCEWKTMNCISYTCPPFWGDCVFKVGSANCICI